MDVIHERTEHVFGRSLEAGGAGDPGPFTATGVFHGIKASVAHVFGSDDLSGRTVLVQGAGSVGGPWRSCSAAPARPSSSPTSTRPGRAQSPLPPVGRESTPRRRSRPNATSTRRARLARR